MYAVGESFYYLIEEDEEIMSVIGDIMLFGNEYLICENMDGTKYTYIYREDEEIVELLDDEDESEEILRSWEEEYYAGGINIGDWDDDEYYEREDNLSVSSEESENYYEIEIEPEIEIEVEEYREVEDEMSSFISGLVGG